MVVVGRGQELHILSHVKNRKEGTIGAHLLGIVATAFTRVCIWLIKVTH